MVPKLTSTKPSSSPTCGHPSAPDVHIRDPPRKPDSAKYQPDSSNSAVPPTFPTPQPPPPVGGGGSNRRGGVGGSAGRRGACGMAPGRPGWRPGTSPQSSRPVWAGFFSVQGTPKTEGFGHVCNSCLNSSMEVEKDLFVHAIHGIMMISGSVPVLGGDFGMCQTVRLSSYKEFCELLETPLPGLRPTGFSETFVEIQCCFTGL